MKTIITGNTKQNNFELVERAIKDSGFQITEVVSGGSNGADKLGEAWAQKNNIPVKKFIPDWKNINHPDATVKKGKFGPYDSRAGFRRNQDMVEYADACIIVDEVRDNRDILTKANTEQLRVFVLKLSEKEYFYEF